MTGMFFWMRPQRNQVEIFRFAYTHVFNTLFIIYVLCPLMWYDCFYPKIIYYCLSVSNWFSWEDPVPIRGESPAGCCQIKDNYFRAKTGVWEADPAGETSLPVYACWWWWWWLVCSARSCSQSVRYLFVFACVLFCKGFSLLHASAAWWKDMPKSLYARVCLQMAVYILS